MASIFKFLIKRKTAILDEPDPMKKYLLAGLGNTGEEYAATRHNIGFQALDALADDRDFAFEARKLGEVGSFKVKGRRVLALKPSTFMNRSGKAIRYWMEKENIPKENLLVITDDINLPFGTLRMKTKGSDGGHNGLKDVQQVLQHTDYHRLRVGVGSEFPKGRQIDYVLGNWNAEELEAMPERLKRISEMVLSFVLAGPKQTMNEFNGT